MLIYEYVFSVHVHAVVCYYIMALFIWSFIFQHLAWQLAGMVAIFGWTTILCGILFFSMKKARILRVSFEYEMKGKVFLQII